jgi:Flp pilus assembly protein TadB
MSSVLSHLVADISNLPWVAIIAVGGGILLTIVVIVGGLLFANRRQQLWHETARLALEKGQPLPAALDESAEDRQPDKPGNDIRAGLILVATGVGLFLFLGAIVGRGLAYVGTIPGLIGVALLLYGLLSASSKRNDPPPSSRP